MKKIINFLCVFLLSAQALATDHYFLKIQMSAEDDAIVLWGRVTETGLQIMTNYTQHTEYPFMDRAEVKKKRKVVIKKIEKILEENAKKQAKLRPPAPTAKIVPMLQFQFTNQELKSCTGLKEFVGFLEQLPLFQEMIKEFQISASANVLAKKCSKEVSEILALRKIKVVPAAEKYTGQGVLLKAQIYFDGSPAEVAAEEAAAVADESLPESEFASLPTRPELLVRYADGTEELAAVRENGYFFKSWTVKEFKRLAPFDLDFRGPNGELILEGVGQLAKIKVGEHRIRFDELESLQVTTANIDSIDKVLVPKIVQAKIDSNQEPTQNIDVGGHVSLFEFQSNAFDKNSGVIIPGLVGNIDINKMFSLHGIGYLPLSLGNAKIKLTYGDLRFSYHPWRQSASLAGGVRFDIGGYFYSASAGSVTNATGESFVSQSVGLHLGPVYNYQHQGHIFEAGYLLGPASSTQGSTVTISGRLRLGYDFKLNQKQGLYFLYMNDRYAIRSDAQNSTYHLSFSSLGLGYKHQF